MSAPTDMQILSLVEGALRNAVLSELGRLDALGMSLDRSIQLVLDVTPRMGDYPACVPYVGIGPRGSFKSE